MYLRLSVFMIFLFNANFTHACTTAIVCGKATPSGRPLLWKHRDTDVSKNRVMKFEDGTFSYLGIVNAPDSLGKEVWAGFNAAGFAIMNAASYNLNTNDTTELKDREGILMKRALQICRSLSDFEQLLDTLPKPLGVEANFGVIDGQGGAAYYETGNFRFVKFDVNDPQIAPFGYLIRTNYSNTGTDETGYGYIRAATANALFNLAYASGQLTPKYILQKGSRCLKHSLTGKALGQPPYSARIDGPLFVGFQDFIPRFTSVSSVVVEGVMPGKSPEAMTVWTILGFPLCSVSIPIWLNKELELPRLVSKNRRGNAPIAEIASHLKELCFPIERGSGSTYLDLSALLNEENEGILQRLIPLENAIFDKAQVVNQKNYQERIDISRIEALYQWIEKRIVTEYQKQFNFKFDIF